MPFVTSPPKRPERWWNARQARPLCLRHAWMSQTRNWIVDVASAWAGRTSTLREPGRPGATRLQRQPPGRGTSRLVLGSGSRSDADFGPLGDAVDVPLAKREVKLTNSSYQFVLCFRERVSVCPRRPSGNYVVIYRFPVTFSSIIAESTNGTRLPLGSRWCPARRASGTWVVIDRV